MWNTGKLTRNEIITQCFPKIVSSRIGNRVKQMIQRTSMCAQGVGEHCGKKTSSRSTPIPHDPDPYLSKGCRPQSYVSAPTHVCRASFAVHSHASSLILSFRFECCKRRLIFLRAFDYALLIYSYSWMWALLTNLWYFRNVMLMLE